MKKKNTGLLIGVVAAAAVGYFLYRRRKSGTQSPKALINPNMTAVINPTAVTRG